MLSTELPKVPMYRVTPVDCQVSTNARALYWAPWSL
ncbi:hypothetical protein FHS29_004004 [Saccharothrix tamanrassetensis]|uniref:Uncharacterized protein n=1 Tax=Saccharothrix tamanrassetensis TaxID=1051531 RepID=A0A841CJC9_9PSEU|nr:hypothetical protein [Saccharothrix tamanrassetensis]